MSKFKPQKGNIMFSIEEVRKNNRTRLLISSFAAHIAAMILVLIMVLRPSTASARRPPTPENFRVTAVTAYTVTVAWDPARNNSGDFNYYLSGAYGVTSAILPKTATSHTFTRLHSGNQYWFFIYARDAGGNASGQVSVTTRTLHDTTPPSPGPFITVTEVGSTYVSISLTPAQDDCPFLSYQVSVNGDPYTALSPNLSATVRFLRPETTYSLTARGRDEGNFWSPFSDPVSVTTLPHTPDPPRLCERVRFWRRQHRDANPVGSIHRRFRCPIQHPLRHLPQRRPRGRPLWFRRPDHRLRRIRRKHRRSHRLGYCRQRTAAGHHYDILLMTSPVQIDVQCALFAARPCNR